MARWVRGNSGKETAVLRKGTGWQARRRGALERMITGGEGEGNLNWQRSIEIRKWHQGGVSQAGPWGEATEFGWMWASETGVPGHKLPLPAHSTSPFRLLQPQPRFPSSRVPSSSPRSQAHTPSSITQRSRIQTLCRLGRGGLALRRWRQMDREFKINLFQIHQDF